MDEGFIWNGTLDETDIRSIYGACHSLRFSGWLELKDAVHEAKVLFLGGDPVEISGGDTARISMWKDGTFRAVQKIPDFEGELTDKLEVAGTLAVTKPSALWAWISQYRLSCDIDLERPGSKAHVIFQNGHAESAQVNGAPELAALARVSSWTDGSFRVRLRPLFADGVLVAVPPMPDSAPSDVLKVGAKQFDYSRAVQLEPAPRTPWPGERDSGPVERVESTARTKTPPRPLEIRSAASLPVDLSGEVPQLRTRSTWPWLVAAALVGAAAGAVVLYQYHLPPFSPLPAPIVEPPLVEKPAQSPSPSPLAPSLPSAAPVAPSSEPEVKTPEKNPPATPKETAPDDKRDKEVEKLVQKGRLLLVSGHAHSALDVFKHAQKLRPKDAAFHNYELQAQGKLGHAELLLDGKGSAVIDGKRFSSPRRLKLPAGPYVLDLGEGEFEVTLKRGEKKKLHVKK